jgi:hypothetical protein
MYHRLSLMFMSHHCFLLIIDHLNASSFLHFIILPFNINIIMASIGSSGKRASPNIFSTYKSTINVEVMFVSTNYSLGCILLAITLGSSNHILVVLNPLHMFCGINVIFRTKLTHYIKSFFVTPFFLLTKIQTSL